MKITKNCVVALSYELEVEGKLADKATEEKPLEYIHGTNMLLPKFESEVEGKEVGDTFAFTLSASQGYGEYNPAFKMELPKSCFEMDGKLRDDLLVVGNIIPMYNNEGQVVQGLIAEIQDEIVIMDFNHPMAGKTLNFTGKIIAVREATQKELKEGLHGEYLPQEGCCHGSCHKHDGQEGGCCHGGDGEGCHGNGEGCCHGDGECNCNS